MEIQRRINRKHDVPGRPKIDKPGRYSTHTGSGGNQPDHHEMHGVQSPEDYDFFLREEFNFSGADEVRATVKELGLGGQYKTIAKELTK